MADQKEPKPYTKVAGTLLSLGMAIFFFERFGLKQFQGVHLPGWAVSIMVIAPLVLVISACVVFMIGRMRRL